MLLIFLKEQALLMEGKNTSSDVTWAGMGVSMETPRSFHHDIVPECAWARFNEKVLVHAWSSSHPIHSPQFRLCRIKIELAASLTTQPAVRQRCPGTHTEF